MLLVVSTAHNNCALFLPTKKISVVHAMQKFKAVFMEILVQASVSGI